MRLTRETRGEPLLSAKDSSSLPKHLTCISRIQHSWALCLRCRHSDKHGCKAGEANQVSTRIREESGYEQGQCRSHEEVGSTLLVDMAGMMLMHISHHRWIAGKISEILGNEDDVVIELCFNLLEGSRFV